MLNSSRQRPLILLAEDEAIIAIELADSLEREGFDIAGPFDTCTAAETWLHDNNPTVALIDNRLRDGPCEALAQDLSERRIPFVVYSGEYESPVPAAFQGGTWIVKPAPFDRVRSLLTLLMQREPRVI